MDGFEIGMPTSEVRRQTLPPSAGLGLDELWTRPEQGFVELGASLIQVQNAPLWEEKLGARGDPDAFRKLFAV